MDLEFYARVRTCEKRVTGKQPLFTFYFPQREENENRTRASN